MNRLYKGFLGLIGGLSLGYAVTTTAVKAESNGGDFPNGVDVLSVAGEDSGTMDTGVGKTIDKQFEENGLMGIVGGVLSFPFRVIPETLYGLTNKLEDWDNYKTKGVLKIGEYVIGTVIDEAKGAWENKLETIATVGTGIVIKNSNNGGAANKSGGSGGGI
ncbi:hypothetical protein HYU07_06095 [Candidatus Woesearchaeota archaeon]|nr:hypothetical protein [Candidatus Woesearchaeota archaeon]